MFLRFLKVALNAKLTLKHKELTITLAKIDTTLDGVASAIKEMKEEKGN